MRGLPESDKRGFVSLFRDVGYKVVTIDDYHKNPDLVAREKYTTTVFTCLSKCESRLVVYDHALGIGSSHHLARVAKDCGYQVYIVVLENTNRQEPSKDRDRFELRL